jgi:DNA-binding response OmpR family regulator
MLRSKLTMQLRADGFSVLPAPLGQSAITLAERCRPDLAVIDLAAGAAEVARQLRSLDDLDPIPIIVLTASHETERGVDALERFAEDFVRKPCSYRELRARIRHVLAARWAEFHPAGRMPLGEGLWLDVERRQLIRVGGPPVHLTPTEMRLVHVLSTNAGQVLPTSLLLQRVWPHGEGTAPSLWEYIRRLRRKLGMRPGQRYYIASVPGAGYRWRKTGSGATSAGSRRMHGPAERLRATA